MKTSFIFIIMVFYLIFIYVSFYYFLFVHGKKPEKKPETPFKHNLEEQEKIKEFVQNRNLSMYRILFHRGYTLKQATNQIVKYFPHILTIYYKPDSDQYKFALEYFHSLNKTQS